jgi:catechol 2,3-dioxygenase-like lactoylglutathione lyase family enzyme
MIIGIHHLGLTVADVERSAQWYESVLGFRDPDNIQLELFTDPARTQIHHVE